MRATRLSVANCNKTLSSGSLEPVPAVRIHLAPPSSQPVNIVMWCVSYETNTDFRKCWGLEVTLMDGFTFSKAKERSV